VKYAHYMFNLHLETTRIVAAQCTRINEYERLAIRTSLDRERLGHKNHGFRQERVSVLDKDQL
jgi:hypothetical protein